MALCVYHETKEAVAVCVVCKQDICAKCKEFGADGMCGMCLEMANARKATMEATRQARVEAASSAPTGAATRAPAKPAPAGAPGKGTGPTRQGPPKPPPKAPPKAPAKPGMCAQHPDQATSAACAHCQKKVCPYCLDLYDHCETCRTLPACARHESMIAEERCVACKMPFCKVCLNGTDRCDRCRTLGLTGDGQKPGGPNKPAKGTQPLRAPVVGQPAPGGGPKPAGPRPAAGGPRKAAPAAARYTPPTQRSNSGLYLTIGGVVAAIGLAIWLFAGGGHGGLKPEEGAQLLKDDMGYVQKAAIALHDKHGRYPDSEKDLLDEIQAEGVKTDKLKLPIKLTVNGAPSEPYGIAFQLVGEGFEVRALDGDGRPFAEGGRDVVLSAPKDTTGSAPTTAPNQAPGRANESPTAPRI